MKKKTSALRSMKTICVLAIFLISTAPSVYSQNILQGCAGSGADVPLEGSGGDELDHPWGVTFDCAGNIYITQQEISTILQIPAAGVGLCLNHYSGTYSSSGGYWPGTGSGPWVGWPSGITSVIPCADFVTATGYAGDGSPAGAPGAMYNLPSGIVYEPVNDRLYIADPGNNCVRAIQNPAAGGTLSTFYNPTGSSALLNIFTPLGETDAYGPVEPDAGINNAYGCGQVTVGTNMAVDGAGNLYVADRGHHCIIEINPAGVAHPIAGTFGVAGYVDGAALGTAQFDNPTGVSVDKDGNVYVADYSNNAIRKINMVAGTVSTLAGGSLAMAFADGPGSSAKFAHPISVAVDDGYRVYVADYRNNRIRVIDQGPLGTAPGNVCTIAGNGATCTSCPYVAAPGYPGINYWAPLGDGADASLGQLFLPSDVKVDKWGNLFFVDMDHNRVRFVCQPKSACTSVPVPAITITSPGGGETPWCTPITFNAKAIFSGCNPGYQWYVNGTLVTGATLPSYTYMASSGDIVTCGINAQPYPYHGSAPYFGLGCPTAIGAMSNPITVTVDPAPPITGPSSVCVGSTITLGETASGTWSITPGGHASLGSPGPGTIPVYGVSTGMETVFFTSTYGCILPFPITVKGGVAPIGGPTTICDGSTTTLFDPTPGGTWGSLDPAVATCSGGVVTPTPGGPGGTAVITYTASADDCPPMTVYYPVVVYLDPKVCVTESCCIPDYMFNFTAVVAGPGPITADYITINAWYLPSVITTGCTGTIPVPGSIALTPISGCSVTISGVTYTTGGVCITGYHNGSCYWPVDHTVACCANANYPFDFVGYKHSHNGSVTPGQQIQKDLGVSPNPNAGSFTISGSVPDDSTSKNGAIEILDMNGRTIYTDVVAIENGGVNKNITLANNIAAGMYFIKFTNGDYKKVFKFTLVR